MKYDFEVNAEDVFELVEYKITIRNSWKVGFRLRLTMLLLKLAKRVCPGKMTIEESDNF
jgi:hypothetical protein